MEELKTFPDLKFFKELYEEFKFEITNDRVESEEIKTYLQKLGAENDDFISNISKLFIKSSYELIIEIMYFAYNKEILLPLLFLKFFVKKISNPRYASLEEAIDLSEVIYWHPSFQKDQDYVYIDQELMLSCLRRNCKEISGKNYIFKNENDKEIYKKFMEGFYKKKKNPLTIEPVYMLYLNSIKKYDSTLKIYDKTKYEYDEWIVMAYLIAKVKGYLSVEHSLFIMKTFIQIENNAKRKSKQAPKCYTFLFSFFHNSIKMDKSKDVSQIKNLFEYSTSIIKKAEKEGDCTDNLLRYYTKLFIIIEKKYNLKIEIVSLCVILNKLESYQWTLPTYMSITSQLYKIGKKDKAYKYFKQGVDKKVIKYKRIINDKKELVNCIDFHVYHVMDGGTLVYGGDNEVLVEISLDVLVSDIKDLKEKKIKLEMVKIITGIGKDFAKKIVMRYFENKNGFKIIEHDDNPGEIHLYID